MDATGREPEQPQFKYGSSVFTIQRQRDYEKDPSKSLSIAKDREREKDRDSLAVELLQGQLGALSTAVQDLHSKFAFHQSEIDGQFQTLQQELRKEVQNIQSLNLRNNDRIIVIEQRYVSK